MALSPAALEETIKQFSGESVLVLLTIDHDSLTSPVRLVCNNEAIVSRGNPYTAVLFGFELPGDGAEPPSAKIAISNVDRSVGQLIEGLVESPECTFEVVLASDPDTVERSWSGMVFQNASYDFDVVTATVGQQVYWTEPWPRKRVRPEKFPGLSP